MANESSPLLFEDIPLEEARRMARGPRLEPLLYETLRQKIQALSTEAVRIHLGVYRGNRHRTWRTRAGMADHGTPLNRSRGLRRGHHNAGPADHQHPIGRHDCACGDLPDRGVPPSQVPQITSPENFCQLKRIILALCGALRRVRKAEAQQPRRADTR